MARCKEDNAGQHIPYNTFIAKTALVEEHAKQSHKASEQPEFTSWDRLAND